MSKTGQSAILSFFPQPQRYAGSSISLTETLPWYKTKTQRMAIGLMPSVTPLGPETGTLLPTGVIKDAMMFGGDFDCYPRVSGVFGWLLYGAFGKVTTTPDTPTPGVYEHKFTFDADQTSLPWFSFRRFVPGTADNGIGTQNHGEVGSDCRIGGIRFTFPARGPIMASMDIIGLNGLTVNNPSWTYTNNWEDSTGIPLSGAGHVYVGGRKLKTLGSEFTFTNQLSGPDEEQVSGNLFQDDVTVKGRAAQIRTIVKWENADWINLFNNGTRTAGVPSQKPYIADSATEGWAFDALFKTGDDALDVRVQASRISWQLGRPLETAGGAIITQELIGTVIEPEAGEEYLMVTIHNRVASYEPMDAPTLTVTDGPAFDVSTGTPVKFFTAAALTVDPSVVNMTGGRVTVTQLYPQIADDVLGFAAPVTLSTGTVSVSATAIGTVQGSNDGANGKIDIALTALSTPALVEDLLENITFDNPSAGTPRHTRLYSVQVRDGKGGYIQYLRYLPVQD